MCIDTIYSNGQLLSGSVNKMRFELFVFAAMFVYVFVCASNSQRVKNDVLKLYTILI